MDSINDNIIEFTDENNNININLTEIELFSLIEKNYSITSKKIFLEINKKAYNFDIKELSKSEIYKLTFSGKSYIIFKEIFINFEKGNNIKNYKFQIYEKIINLIEKYQYLNTYIKIKGKKLKINMDINTSEQNKLNFLKNVINSNDNTIFDGIFNFILDESSFNNKKGTCNIDKENNFFDIFGEYEKDYINNINPSKTIIYPNNVISRKFSCYTKYNMYDINFNFITGSEKIGKTIYVLFKNKKNNYHIYFNLKILYELEVIKIFIKLIKYFSIKSQNILKDMKIIKNFQKNYLKIILILLFLHINFKILFLKL